ncbi:MAG: nitroreductase family deazaflavin-dependent oxidoreductase [Actinobacteria bacterium]|nr:nitroreductase family deazaflavin-dependent oxidoreductase [Actinomycetota bacterium]
MAFKVITGLHAAVFRVSGGRVFGRAGGMPVLILTTMGRKSGRERSTVLTTPVHDDDRVVLVASFGGDDRHPDWYRNLRENPDVRVRLAGRQQAMVARLASPNEKEALWPRIVDAYGGYDRYQQKTDRDIPVVILERRR